MAEARVATMGLLLGRLGEPPNTAGASCATPASVCNVWWHCQASPRMLLLVYVYVNVRSPALLVWRVEVPSISCGSNSWQASGCQRHDC